MTETFRHNVDIENHLNHELYETEQQLLYKDNEIAQDISSIITNYTIQSHSTE